MITPLAWFFTVLGSFFIVSSVLGLFRFPDFFTKIHAAGINDSIGIPLCLLGLSLMQTSLICSIKILAIMLLFFILGPTSNHAIIKAAWMDKQKEK
jgi:multicomponent Na+:H+ antiporter subunit G